MDILNKFKKLLSTGAESIKESYQNTSEKISGAYQRINNTLNKQKNKEILLSTIQKGIEERSIKAQDFKEIEQMRQEWDITDAEMSEIKIKAFKFAMQKVREQVVISKEAIDLLLLLEEHFQFNSQEYDAIKAEITRIKNIFSIQQGQFITFDVPEINLYSNEECFWVENAEYVEFKTEVPFIPKPPKRFDAHTPYIFGETKGVVFPIQNNQVIANGKLYITTQRVIFLAEDKDYAIKNNKIDYFEPFANGLMIYADKEPDKFKYHSTQNAEVIAFVLQNVLRMAKN
ncbi:MAG: hypothetical protein NZ519_07900 [Bacteroidia bacterium]|nr:hypothetical protein [Bacteroidia bacterium]MDW8301416.1 hypothetical protein [Bacteroidia bacterium]